MLDGLAALLYVMCRELFMVYFFCLVFIKELSISRPLFYGLLAVDICIEWIYFVSTDFHLSFLWQYTFSLSYFMCGLFLFNQDFKKKFFLITFIGNIAFLTQTLALVFMEQLTPNDPNIILGTITLFLANILATPGIIRFLKSYKDTILGTKENNIVGVATLILLLNLLGTIMMYDFQSPRNWSLLWGRSCNIIPALIFIQVIFHLLREKERNSELNAKMRYLENLRQSKKSYFDFIIATWSETRRMRHDLRHVALLLKEYLSSGQYDKLEHELQSINTKTSNRQPKETTP